MTSLPRRSFLLRTLAVSLGVAGHIPATIASFSNPESTLQKRRMIVGIGGAGGNIVEHMLSENHTEFDYLCINSDRKGLDHSTAAKKILIGNGLGACGNAFIGRIWAEAAAEEITEAISCASEIVIVAGLGGGTGTGVTPVVDEIARKIGIRVRATVCMPFYFEGNRYQVAEQTLKDLHNVLQDVQALELEKLCTELGEDTSFLELFAIANQCLVSMIRSPIL